MKRPKPCCKKGEKEGGICIKHQIKKDNKQVDGWKTMHGLRKFGDPFSSVMDRQREPFDFPTESV